MCGLGFALIWKRREIDAHPSALDEHYSLVYRIQGFFGFYPASLVSAFEMMSNLTLSDLEGVLTEPTPPEPLPGSRLSLTV